jgi:hypothetical protein
VLKLLYRFGLGWLVGRRWLLMVTNDAEGAGTRDSVHRYRLEDGAVVVPAESAPWLDDLAAKPVATIHAHPGPLAVAADLRAEEVVLTPTGRQAPPAVVPDLNWVLPAVVVALLGLRSLVRFLDQTGHTTGNRGCAIGDPAGSSSASPSNGGEVRHRRGAWRASSDR